MNREQCRRCVHFKTLTMGNSIQACHYMLDTGMRRDREGDKCLSRETKREAKRRSFDAPGAQR